MRQNDTQRQPGEQPQGRMPQQSPSQQAQSHQQPPQQPPQNPQGQPQQPQQSQQGQQHRQGQQPPIQGQPPQVQSQPPQSMSGQPVQGSQPLQQPPQSPPQGRQQPPQTGGISSGMVGQQAQNQQMGPQAVTGGQPSQQMGRGQTHLHSVSIDEILQKDVVAAQLDTPLPTITAQMNQENVGAVVLVEDDKPVSLLTDRKIALALEEMPDISEKTAEDLSSGDIVTGTDEMSVYDALQQMSDESIRRLPITDEDGSLVGIITLDDVIVLLAKELQNTAEIIQAQSPHL